jgi:SpoVK/Ycf46/Vps4 family AAA+-type ATPase
MRARKARNWTEKNQDALGRALARVRQAVESWWKQSQGIAPSAETPPEQPRETAAGEIPSALETICAAFQLSAFERDLLLLCAGPDLDAGFAALVGAANGDPRKTNPTFGLALAALPGAHWSALSASAPLRRWRLIELGPGETLTTSALRIEERVLHFLTGAKVMEERLQGLIQPVAAPALLPESQRAAAEQIVRLLGSCTGEFPLLQLCGEAAADQRAVAAAAANAVELRLHRLRASDIPALPAEREALARLLEREAALERLAFLIDLHDSEPAEQNRATVLLETIQGLVFAIGREALTNLTRETVRVDIARPPVREQHELWQVALGPLSARLNGALEAVARQFQFGAQEICDAAGRLRLAFADASGGGANEKKISDGLWKVCRGQARIRLDSMAQRLEPTARWEDLVLPESQTRTLREIATHVRQRFRVYEKWGFAAKSARGLGISALFVGASGTGKTMAAEVLANELQLDLFRIDLSAVVNKYIGETEKNLRRVFDAADTGGAILLFDEADALFGKRSEVKDSHDRYANIEVGYLLQRMEAYRGLAILTTNVKNALDQAFLRRLRFVMQFPFPDRTERGAIWSRVFPAATPTDGLSVEKLANLNVTGGNIRNIALNAAFLAADSDEPVRMEHLLQAARSECAKLERPFNDAEIGGWI